MNLLAKIRTIPDFPKPGILFYDVTTLFQDASAFRQVVDEMAAPWTAPACEAPPEYIVGIDARGFLLASALAYRLNAGLVVVRKRGKLPWRTESISYDLEYGTAEVEIHVDAVRPGSRVLIADDLLATGGTAAAAVELVRRTGGAVLGCTFLLELDGLGGRARLAGTPVGSLITVPA